MNREILQQALDALKFGGLIKKTQAIALLEAELAKPEQEPVAWRYKGKLHDVDPSNWASPEFAVTPLYTAPPRKEWVGLTDEEIELIVDANTTDISCFDICCDGFGVARAVMEKLKEKNNG